LELADVDLITLLDILFKEKSMSELELCKRIATEAHAGQKRRDGIDYIHHPRSVAYEMPNDCLACVAWLHDVIEDTDETKESLLEKGVCEVTVDAVVKLSKIKGEDYLEYINRISDYGGLAKIKIMDMFDNLSDSPTDRQKVKYRKAIGTLLRSI